MATTSMATTPMPTTPMPATQAGASSVTQADKARRFVQLHQGPGAFLIGNPWDAGSARVLAQLGYPALATSSGASAAVLGRRDGSVSRDEAFAHVATIVAATDLPVSADLEKCFGDDPATVAQTVAMAVQAGLVGCSVEDATGDAARPLFDLAQATDRVAAAAAVAHAQPFPFLLTARTENFLRGNPSLDDTIARLQAYERAGADVLMAPGLPDLDAVRTVCSALNRPFNFMAGIRGRSFSVALLQGAGVRRISLASSLHRAAMTGLVQAAREVAEHGSFDYLDRSLPSAELNAFLR